MLPGLLAGHQSIKQYWGQEISRVYSIIHLYQKSCKNCVYKVFCLFCFFILSIEDKLYPIPYIGTVTKMFPFEFCSHYRHGLRS